jgi:hypothetical protein
MTSIHSLMTDGGSTTEDNSEGDSEDEDQDENVGFSVSPTGVICD